MRREADVAVVEPDHEEAPVRQQGAERLLPGDHLGPEAHHQQERARARLAESVVLQLDVADAGPHVP